MNDIHTYLQTLQPFSGEINPLFDESMANHTTFRIGGPAQLFLSPDNQAAFCACIENAFAQQIPYTVIGNGSNLLVQDSGVAGIVICTEKLKKTQVVQSTIHAQAGILLSALAKQALEQELTGLEFAAGIPGTLGGAVFMNAGAYGGEMSQLITSVTFIEANGATHSIPASECAFGYRTSIFRQHPDWSILSASLQLSAGSKETIRAAMDELAKKRRAKQPLEMPSAGSTFKRPEGYFAGALIEQANLKGFTIGGAQVSEKHAGFIVNRGGATCTDVLQLIQTIQEKVRAESGVTLECEVRIL